MKSSKGCSCSFILIQANIILKNQHENNRLLRLCHCSKEKPVLPLKSFSENHTAISRIALAVEQKFREGFNIKHKVSLRKAFI